MTITIILFDSALELIPEDLRSHPLIKREWKKGIKEKKKGILLDGAIHRPLLDLLEEKNKRGRPDIIHQCLLNLVYSPLFQSNKLRIILHTRNNLSIEIPSNWRIPVNYNRFCGLFSQLLHTHQVPLEGNPILTLQNKSLAKILSELNSSNIFLCDLKESFYSQNMVYTSLPLNYLLPETVFLIGGFQEGQPNLETSSTLQSIRELKILALYPEIKPAWVIAGKLIFLLESGDVQ